MPKKPTLKIVVNSAPADAGAPPPNLGQAGGNLWRSIMREYKVEDFGGFEMLTQICKALDRAESCAEEIENGAAGSFAARAAASRNTHC